MATTSTAGKTTSKAISKTTKQTKRLSDQEVQTTYTRFQNEMQALASKIGELESEAEEHELVLSTLTEVLQNDPQRKCFRLIGGVLVERTVKDVVPALRTNHNGIKQVIVNLAEQYKSKETEFNEFVREYNIKTVNRS